jgi:sterol desaturase/sphingolipid hydroxylase (fatty acid hydroxylase superfamily)
MGKGMRSNFSTKLAIWDWMFGTAYFPSNQQATGYGVRAWFPKHYVGQTLYAFRPLRPLGTGGRGSGVGDRVIFKSTRGR